MNDNTKIFRDNGKINWLTVAYRVNCSLGTTHSANYCFQVHTGRQSSKVVQKAIIQAMQEEHPAKPHRMSRKPSRRHVEARIGTGVVQSVTGKEEAL